LLSVLLLRFAQTQQIMMIMMMMMMMVIESDEPTAYSQDSSDWRRIWQAGRQAFSRPVTLLVLSQIALSVLGCSTDAASGFALQACSKSVALSCSHASRHFPFRAVALPCRSSVIMLQWPPSALLKFRVRFSALRPSIVIEIDRRFTQLPQNTP
jgi:hypothetical protein